MVKIPVGKIFIPENPVLQTKATVSAFSSSKVASMPSVSWDCPRIISLPATRIKDSAVMTTTIPVFKSNSVILSMKKLKLSSASS